MSFHFLVEPSEPSSAAKGVVEIDDQLKIILGSDAKKLKKYIDELK